MQVSVMSQLRAPDYEYFMQTKNVPSGTTVVFAAVSHESPRWDEFKDLDSGSDSVVISIYGNSNACGQGHEYDQGGTLEDPSIGYLKYRIKVINAGKNAYVDLIAEGQSFLGDVYFTYDWDTDRFYTGGNCGSYGTQGIEENTVWTHVDDGNGNNKFQPTNPSNLTLEIINLHPVLTWNRSVYPTFTTKKYKVQRKELGWNWITIASNLSDTTYTDYDVTTSGKNRVWLYYRVQAYTSFPKYSPGYSNQVGVRGVVNYKQIAHDIKNQNAIPREFGLSQNHPNPFNPTTTIKYELPEPSYVSMVIYDLMGHKVIKWENDYEDAGFRHINWDGTNVNGIPVPSGIYIYRLTARSKESDQVFTQSRKMVLLK
jgi:hypothetical protein